MPPTAIGRRSRAAVDLRVARRRRRRRERLAIGTSRSAGARAVRRRRAVRTAGRRRPAARRRTGDRVLAALAQPLGQRDATAVLPTPVGPNTAHGAVHGARSIVSRTMAVRIGTGLSTVARPARGGARGGVGGGRRARRRAPATWRSCSSPARCLGAPEAVLEAIHEVLAPGGADRLRRGRRDRPRARDRGGLRGVGVGGEPRRRHARRRSTRRSRSSRRAPAR